MSKDIGLAQAKLIGDAHEFGAVENLSESAETVSIDGYGFV